MEITITPDTYTPSVDQNGNYVDNSPIIRHGMYCPCSARNTCFVKRQSFINHTKSNTHQQWLLSLNQNKANYYIEMLKNKELVEHQQKIIAQLENQIRKNALTIDYLTEQLTTKMNQNACSVDLLDVN